VSARAGGGDPSNNPRLRAVMDKALTANMTKDTIERAIKKGIGAAEGDNYEEVRYEGYGPGGIAVMVDCLTDNRNRTVGEVRHAFSKAGGNLGTDGSVSYLFSKTGILSFSAGVDEDQLMEAALEAGADDVVSNDDGSADVLTSPEVFETVKGALERAGLKPESAEITLRAANTTSLGQEDAEKMIRLLERLEDLDDVQNVYSNADISEEILEKIA
ncbi:MAG: YebC/PmpR family DNA-binding transcriptional regulator, partial [Methylococcaceae bacterium]|nr:YebC/PmpR family DNA-binding transcriptional regulator [Methylococcaceae bacterium]